MLATTFVQVRDKLQLVRGTAIAIIWCVAQRRELLRLVRVEAWWVAGLCAWESSCRIPLCDVHRGQCSLNIINCGAPVVGPNRVGISPRRAPFIARGAPWRSVDRTGGILLLTLIRNLRVEVGFVLMAIGAPSKIFLAASGAGRLGLMTMCAALVLQSPRTPQAS